MMEFVSLTLLMLAALFLAARGIQVLAPAPIVIRVENKRSHLG